MKKYICLRDDDTCYRTTVSDLVNAYEWIWGKYPITIGVVPFSHGSQEKMTEFEDEKDRILALREWELNATSNELTAYHVIHPLGENAELVSEIKKQLINGMIEVAQHGVSRRYCQYGPEMVIPYVSLSSIRDGKEYLSKLFDTDIKTFIPPSNTIDLECAIYLKSIGMNILSSGSIKYDNYFRKVISKLSDPFFLKSKIMRLSYKPITKPSGIVMINSITYNNFNSKDEIYSKVVNRLNKTGFASITTHYMLLNQNGWHGQHKEYQKNFQGLIKDLSSLDEVVFVTAKEYTRLLLNKYYREG